MYPRSWKITQSGHTCKTCQYEVVVVADLTARSLPIPEYPGWNPVFCNIYWTIYCRLFVEKTETQLKETVNGPFKKILLKLSKYTNSWKRQTGIIYQQNSAALSPSLIFANSFLATFSPAEEIYGPTTISSKYHGAFHLGSQAVWPGTEPVKLFSVIFKRPLFVCFRPFLITIQI